MYTDYRMAEEAVSALGEFVDAIRNELNEHSQADPRWNVRLIAARKAARILVRETEALWNEWNNEVSEKDK
jgi:hypothetical protein